MTAALEIQGLNKSFGAIQVARDITLSLEEGARRALIGPNGAGKTTFVSLLSGVVRPDSGRVLLFGQDITSDSASVRTKKGLVRTFQVSNLFGKLSVLENVFLAVSERSNASFDLWTGAGKKRELIDKAEHLIEQLRLTDNIHDPVSQIAYGRQRLVEIALALALEPRVLLLDEPAAGIPHSETDVLLEAVYSLPTNIAILMIEHDMQVVRRFASEVTVLVGGAVLMTGTPKDVMVSEQVREVYLGHAGANRFSSETLHA
jgi:ABC-type branched-subunit amino acid transport system ATPase component